MDPEIARKRKERSKQRALKAQKIFSSNPEAKHLFTEGENKNTEVLISSPDSSEIANLPNNAPFTSEIIEKQNICAENESEKVKNQDSKIEIEEKIEEKVQIEIDEKINANVNNNTNEIILPSQNPIDNEFSKTQENHCMPKNKKNDLDLDDVLDLIPTEPKSPNIISIKLIPFLMAPFFSYFQIPFGFLILVLMDGLLFFLFDSYDKDIISIGKHIYKYFQIFSLRVTSLQCILIVFRIFLSFYV